MRKITSAILILVLLFNLFGYRFVADYIQAGNDRQFEARLDNNRFDESQLVELKIPVNLPYQTSWSDFERFDGEVELNGILYKYVKRKVFNDTLILLCIPNQQKMNLQTAKNDFIKNTTDLAQNTSSKKTGNSKTIDFKKLLNEFVDHTGIFHTFSIDNYQNDFAYTLLVNKLLSSPHVSPEQPPDFMRA